MLPLNSDGADSRCYLVFWLTTGVCLDGLCQQEFERIGWAGQVSHTVDASAVPCNSRAKSGPLYCVLGVMVAAINELWSPRVREALGLDLDTCNAVFW